MPPPRMTTWGVSDSEEAVTVTVRVTGVLKRVKRVERRIELGSAMRDESVAIAVVEGARTLMNENSGERERFH